MLCVKWKFLRGLPTLCVYYLGRITFYLLLFSEENRWPWNGRGLHWRPEKFRGNIRLRDAAKAPAAGSDRPLRSRRSRFAGQAFHARGERAGVIQRIVIADAFRTSLEVRDYPGAAVRSNDLDVVGVGPEQNFTYIAGLEPKMAFITDIRRGNLHLHLMYKAIFEMSKDRADFLGLLFSKARPEGVTAGSGVNALFAAYDAAGHLEQRPLMVNEREISSLRREIDRSPRLKALLKRLVEE